ncbi:MAG: N-acyl-D-aspartate/D-glutamate deacylase [Cryomorphaceae bacterium]|jgi:N-acyl-D-aspartate/D-glutamate deacylase
MKYNQIFLGCGIRAFTLLALASALLGCSHARDGEPIKYDLVFTGGRVIDPESGFDHLTNVAINGKTIAAISDLPLTGIETIDASGLVISPGFIDLHSHALSRLGQKLQAKDGVTTALELEAGVYPIDALAQIMGNNSVINYGASTSHLAIRQRVIERIRQPHISTSATPLTPGLDSEIIHAAAPSNAAFTQVASAHQLSAIRAHLQQGITNAGLGIGLLLDYLSGAVNKDELEMIFEVAAAAEVPVFVHVRRGLPGDPAGLKEIIDLARKHQTSVHVCHLNASAMGGIDHFLELISNAQAEGVDITSEAYPYNAGSTGISAAVFGRDWQSTFGITYKDIEWAATGERFTESMWNDYRQRFPAGKVIHHYGNDKWTQAALNAPGIIVASDAMPLATTQDKVHPRGIGTFSKVLGRYTDMGDNSTGLNLITALAKMTVLPAKRMEGFAPAFKYKGRLRKGFDADLTLFDPKSITDMATFKQPQIPSKGIQYVLVNGEFILKSGLFIEDVLPGQLIKRAGGKTLQSP